MPDKKLHRFVEMEERGAKRIGASFLWNESRFIGDLFLLYLDFWCSNQLYWLLHFPDTGLLVSQ